MKDPKGPFVIIAAFWSDEDVTDAVAIALPQSRFPRPAGYSSGAVVSFRREIAEQPAFRRNMGRFDLDDLFQDELP